MEPTIEEFTAGRGKALLRFALMLCANPHSAEDLVQSALARVYPRWARVARLSHPEAYVKKVILREHLRWRRKRSGRELPVSESVDPMSGETDAAGAHADRDAAWALLAGLPPRQRAVLVLRYYEDLADAEIGADRDSRLGAPGRHRFRRLPDHTPPGHGAGGCDIDACADASRRARSVLLPGVQR